MLLGSLAMPPAPSNRSAWLGLAVLTLPTALVAMDATVLYLAVPALSADLRPTASELLWITDIYGFILAGLLIAMGVLGDRIGRRRLLLVGGAAFAAASVLAAVSTSPTMLIAARALMGVAGATLMPSTLSLIHHMFADARQRTAAIGIWVMSLSLGTVVGPVAGGLLLEHFDWGAVFLLALPVMGLLLALGPRLLPEFRDPDPGRFDLGGVALSVAAVLSVVFAVKRMAEDGVEPLPAAALAAGLALGAAFLRRQGRIEAPLLDLGGFRSRGFGAALSANALTFFVLLGTYLGIAQYLQIVHELSPVEAGLWLLPYSAGVVAGSAVSSALAARLGPARVLAGGLVAAAAGLLVLSLIEAGSGLALLVAGSVLLALGIAPVLTLATDVVVGAAPPERAGGAAALSETGAELGGALGVAVLGSLGAAVYRGELGEAMPAGLPPAAAEGAERTAPEAVALAAQLPEGLGAPLLSAAQAAFADSLAVTAAVGAALLLATALAVVRSVREPEPADLAPARR